MPAPFFDTNIVIDWLRRYPQAAAEIALYGRHRISRITWVEVLAGEPAESRERVKRTIEPFAIIELDARIGAVASDIRHRSRMKLMDALILATAQVHGAMVVTRNIKDFSPDMPGIRVPYIL